MNDLSADIESEFRRFGKTQPVAVEKALSARKKENISIHIRKGMPCPCTWPELE
jgi:hypothetical protein